MAEIKKILILGQSVAGAAFIERLRAVDTESSVTVISSGNSLAAKRELFAAFLAKEIKEDQVLFKAKNFYEQNKVQLVFGKKVIRVDFKRKRVVTEEKEQFDFDILIIADLGIRFPEIKGVNKAGVFSLRNLDAVKDVVDLLPLVESVAIEDDSIWAVQTALAFAKRGKEVIFVVSSNDILASMVEEEASRVLAQQLEKNNVRIIKENKIQEILGEGEVKAVRLKTGKVLACQIAIIGNTKTDLRLFAESVLQIQNGILTNGEFQTNLENVFAADTVCESEASALPLEEQGRMIAQKISDQEISAKPLLRTEVFDLLGCPVAFIGTTRSSADTQKFTVHNEAMGSFAQIFSSQNILVGAVLINTALSQEKIVRLIQEKIDISGSEEQIFNDQNSYEHIVSLSQEKRACAQPEQETFAATQTDQKPESL
ncbi:MAG: FAD-dependent oxidoreductase [Candidatus Omnitrophota bacterium]